MNPRSLVLIRPRESPNPLSLLRTIKRLNCLLLMTRSLSQLKNKQSSLNLNSPLQRNPCLMSQWKQTNPRLRLQLLSSPLRLKINKRRQFSLRSKLDPKIPS